jgi:hypothetical protein
MLWCSIRDGVLGHAGVVATRARAGQYALPWQERVWRSVRGRMILGGVNAAASTLS